MAKFNIISQFLKDISSFAWPLSFLKNNSGTFGLSNEMSFKRAAALAYREGMPKANPVLLEPVGSLKVTVPENYVGDVMGDLNKRRGRVMGIEPLANGKQSVLAEVPYSEMTDYVIALRASTQGRGRFDFEFIRYDEVPASITEKVIAEAKND